MGIWERFKSVFANDKTTATPEPAPASTTNVRTGPALELADEPAPAIVRSYKQTDATARFYDAEKTRAKAAGQTVKGYRAGYIPAEKAKAKLVAGPDGMPPLKLVSSNNGMDFALPDGQLVDYKTLSLRHFNIFAFRVVGMGYYDDVDKPFKFRNGQRVGIKREPDNEHDANAVAITVDRGATKVGYVNKQRAKWVSELLDSGGELEGIVLQTKSSPRVLLTTPAMLAYLQRP
ncbi:HIRAN domain-containing protein [Arthrobacter sp. ok362]|uniref:HIRAN domain-containing protein n=1 Tax=Arthrobacter sp. ok362 TaxID=1761745 RepID=UPI0008908500|nr:HIRAN domain-containing protein [Arthrobacter sp. ok362]SDL76922.1 HIRAN domain-containing protein [Arthrobacter sp. ok362]